MDPTKLMRLFLEADETTNANAGTDSPADRLNTGYAAPDGCAATADTRGSVCLSVPSEHGTLMLNVPTVPISVGQLEMINIAAESLRDTSVAEDWILQETDQALIDLADSINVARLGFATAVVNLGFCFAADGNCAPEGNQPPDVILKLNELFSQVNKISEMQNEYTIEIVRMTAWTLSAAYTGAHRIYKFRPLHDCATCLANHLNIAAKFARSVASLVRYAQDYDNASGSQGAAKQVKNSSITGRI